MLKLRLKKMPTEINFIVMEGKGCNYVIKSIYVTKEIQIFGSIIE